MDDNYNDIFRNCVKDGKISENHLKHLPKLKDCENWKDAEFLGKVKYTFKHSNIDGGLIKYSGKIFYINNKQIDALSFFYKWNTLKEIKVIQ